MIGYIGKGDYVRNSEIQITTLTGVIKSKVDEDKILEEVPEAHIARSELISRDVVQNSMEKIVSRVETIKVGVGKYLCYVADNISTANNTCREKVDITVHGSRIEALNAAECVIIGRALDKRCVPIRNIVDKSNREHIQMFNKAKQWFNGLNRTRSDIHTTQLDSRLKEKKANYGKSVNTVTRNFSILKAPVCEKISIMRKIQMEYKSATVYYVQLWSMYKKIEDKEPIWIVTVNSKQQTDNSGRSRFMDKINSVGRVFKDKSSALKEFRIQEEMMICKGYRRVSLKVPDSHSVRKSSIVDGANSVVLDYDKRNWIVKVNVNGKISEQRYDNFVKAERDYTVAFVHNFANLRNGVESISSTKRYKNVKIEEELESGGLTHKQAIDTKSIIDGKCDNSDAVEFIRSIYKVTAKATNSFSGTKESTKDNTLGLKLLRYEDIVKGIKIMDKIDAEVKGKKREDVIYALSLEYYETIPRDVKGVIDSTSKVDNEYDVLETYLGVNKVKDAFETEDDAVIYEKLKYGIIARVPSDEYRYIKHFVESTVAKNHHYKLKVTNMYKLDNKENKYPFDKELGNVKLLFHGTGTANLYPILCSRLVLPTRSGMFGRGIYFADNYSKSANYSFGYWGGDTKGEKKYIFVAEVALGRQAKYTSAQGRLTKPPKGFDSVMGCKGANLYNNEFIVYNENQARLKYVVEVQMVK